MTETTENQTPTHEQPKVEQVTPEVVKEINNEVQKVETTTKDEIVKTINESNAALKAELEAIKQQNEAIRAKQAAEAEQARLKAELEKEKNFLNEVNQKHIIPQKENPTAPQPVQEPEAPRLSVDQEWALFDQASRAGELKAKMIPESMADRL